MRVIIFKCAGARVKNIFIKQNVLHPPLIFHSFSLASFHSHFHLKRYRSNNKICIKYHVSWATKPRTNAGEEAKWYETLPLNCCYKYGIKCSFFSFLRSDQKFFLITTQSGHVCPIAKKETKLNNNVAYLEIDYYWYFRINRNLLSSLLSSARLCIFPTNMRRNKRLWAWNQFNCPL